MPVKMYIIINDTLKMGKGKMVAQGGHAVQFVTEKLVRRNDDIYEEWKSNGFAKVVLKTSQDNMNAIMNVSSLPFEHVIDAGLTQVEPGSLTAIAFYPVDNQLFEEKVRSICSPMGLL